MQSSDEGNPRNRSALASLTAAVCFPSLAPRDKSLTSACSGKMIGADDGRATHDRTVGGLCVIPCSLGYYGHLGTRTVDVAALVQKVVSGVICAEHDNSGQAILNANDWSVLLVPFGIGTIGILCWGLVEVPNDLQGERARRQSFSKGILSVLSVAEMERQKHNARSKKTTRYLDRNALVDF